MLTGKKIMRDSYRKIISKTPKCISKTEALLFRVRNKDSALAGHVVYCVPLYRKN